MSAASIATSVPVPMAIPTSAWASAGASLMPSPTMPTRAALGLQAADLAGLVLGQHLGQHPADADLAGDRRGGAALSPVIITTSRPSLRSAATAATESSLTVSATAMTPAGSPSTATSIGVLPVGGKPRR